ncbi:hypothetical protein D1872_246880 [compost metagenome]
MFLNDFFKDIPYFRANALHFPLRALDVVSQTFVYELLHHERLEQFKRHFLRQAALVHLEVWAYDDYGTTGIVDPFPEQVLPEAALFPLQHVAERFQRAVPRPGNRTSAAAVVDQGVNGFLKHPFFVLYDDVRRAQIE